ncbi:helix-turn-helix domain-containing protein [Alkalihalobacterium bogoriense]|uniref:helix-turn-helix domain-containing protein n=1 Tax=Alkalihalobacterium bogoriense TaxID=246272 RepID=UPI00047C7388|nr:XRE family transcriptional regulator [Alkalihalobacterium bogoriense]
MESVNLNDRIGTRLKKIRMSRKLSLDKLAQITDVSKPMLGQIERGESNPTVSTLWKIANGLQVPFTTFIEEEKPQVKVVNRDTIKPLPDESGQFLVRPIFPKEIGKPVECFSITLKQHCHYCSEAHPEGVEEYIFVEKGNMSLTVATQEFVLHQGEAIQFAAHYEHEYKNIGGDDCILVMMIFYR